jgi:hypothetical protein
MRQPILPALCLAALVGCAPVDNSGGEPPTGDPLGFEVLTPPGDLFCDALADSAALMVDEAGIDAMLEACSVSFDGAENPQPRADLVAALDAGDAGDVLVYAVGSAGGCIGEAWIEDVTLDGEVLRPWMIKEDSSYGRVDVACTTDYGLSNHLVRVSGAEAATSAELHIGVFNPELPGGPESP